MARRSPRMKYTLTSVSGGSVVDGAAIVLPMVVVVLLLPVVSVVVVSVMVLSVVVVWVVVLSVVTVVVEEGSGVVVDPVVAVVAGCVTDVGTFVGDVVAESSPDPHAVLANRNPMTTTARRRFMARPSH